MFSKLLTIRRKNDNIILYFNCTIINKLATMIITVTSLIETDERRVALNQYCFIHCFGKAKVPEKGKWKNNVRGGINRLYFIVDGEGGYFRGSEKKHFKKGFMYFLPSYDNIPTWSSYETPESQLDHLYMSFEILPPIITDQVIEFDPKEDPVIEAALYTWMRIAEKYRSIRNIDDESLDYLKSTALFIMNKLIHKSNIKMLEDKTMLYALELIHRNVPNSISIHEIAKSVNMSYDGFIKKFKIHLRTTPYQYIKKLKVRTALALHEDGVTFEEAATRCGYSEAAALLHAISNEKHLHKIK